MVALNSNNPTAGSAEPYWFEWKTGLLQLVELLDDDSELLAIAFQLHGTKGWDDVGVRLRDGTTRLLQTKHSRSGDRLTFGDLVAPESEHVPSLLRALAGAWKAEKDVRGTIECAIVTNRTAGTNWYQDRPPLAEFFDKVKARVGKAALLDDVRWEGEDERYPRAWEIFIAELSDLEQSEKLAFLQALSIEVDAPDLELLEANIRGRLAALTGLPASSVNALFNALVANLRKWTCQTRRDKEWVDREALRACLACEENTPPWLGHCEVETPEPFFPSRNVVVDALRLSLLDESPHKVDFLAAEPGAGKTSCISKLARSGAILWKEQCVSIRFYVYRPIRPGQSDVGSDAGISVQPEALWLALLWQIRDHLRKTKLLAELNVPVWIEGMRWEIAREHVLRIADALGSRWDRCFVVCIDGIDHAARARRKNLRDFLETLPTPDEIPAHVRFLLAGQPADAYPEYPFFLHHAHTAVAVHPLDTLTDQDIRALWRAAKPRLSSHAEDAVIRILAEKAQRRTLPTVYAVEDIRTSATVEEVAGILDSRPLADSLHNYYDAIWSAATSTTTDGTRLAAAFALLRERPSGELMASAFSKLGKSAVEWTDILRRLRPLVRETVAGFELVHNDLRVHLDAGLTNEPFVRTEAASAFANHYRKSTSNRLAAHLSLLDLLTTASRRTDFADDFRVDWVIEAGALGVTNAELAVECSAAFSAAVGRQDWLLLHSVACASLTLHRLHDCVSNWAHGRDPVESKTAPIFLPVEGEPRPFELWSASDFSELLAACQQLVDCGAEQRAAVILKQWIGGISVEALAEHLASRVEEQSTRTVSADRIRVELEQFGRLCAVCHLPLASTESDLEKNSGYRAAIEAGWVRGLADLPDRRKALRLWSYYSPRYLAPWVSAVKEAARRCRWGEVSAILNRLEESVASLDAADGLTLGWHAARAKPRNGGLWQQPFSTANFGLAPGSTSLTTLRVVAQWTTYTNVVREPAQVAEDLLPLLDQRQLESKNTSAVTILLRASGVIGRLLRYYDRGDFEGAKIAVPPASLAPLLDTLWCREPDWRNLPHDEVRTPGEIGSALAKIAWECGAPYRRLLCDLARAKFDHAMLLKEGTLLFNMLLECGDCEFLDDAIATKARDVIDRLHEDEAPSRNGIIANLLHFTRRLGMDEMALQLTERLRRTRIGYSSSKEWVFLPLVRWFELARKLSPAAWKTEGMQLLALDRISEQQHGDNGFGGEVIAEVSAAAMECGPDDFEVLFGFLAAREAKYPLYDLAKAAQGGFEICLRGQHAVDEESTLARIAIAIAVGRWPAESPLKTVNKLLTAREVPQELAQQPPWQKAIRIAAEIQGVSAGITPVESEVHGDGPDKSRSSETILEEIIQPRESSWMRLRDIASLAVQTRGENHMNRAALVSAALGVLESADAFSRCLEFNEFDLMSRFYNNLSEPERWRLLGAITAVTGEIRSGLIDPQWAFMVAFAAVDLTCRARAANAGPDFTTAVFHQLLGMHWKWHGVSPPASPLVIGNAPSAWPDAARRVLLSVMQTDACETLYMAMSGLRFFAEIFPEQIPAICRAGLGDENLRDAILPLAQLWATRYPRALAPALGEFARFETIGMLHERLDAWVVGALQSMASGNRARNFDLPSRDESPEIAFPGDAQLLEGEAQMDGLIRHNTFARMANERLRRVGVVLGSMDSAFRHMARAVKEGGVEFPPMALPQPQKLAFDSSYPRQHHKAEHIVSDAILHQCAGETWSPADAAAVRLLIGYGVDPWIASATPNEWPDKDAWPSDFDIEPWFEAGASKTADVGLRLTALLEGHDLGSSMLLLGAVLHCPTYRRDLEFRFWLAAPGPGGDQQQTNASLTRSGRTLAGWIGGWSFAASQPPNTTTVHFVRTLVNYPNSDLDLTPTSHWTSRWGWKPDPENGLRFQSKDGAIVAWYERWFRPDSSHNRIWRQPFLGRWVARRDSFPTSYDELRAWLRRNDFTSAPLSRPE